MTMRIRAATVTDADSISTLIVPLAEKYIAREFPAEGVRQLLGSMTPDAVRDYIASGYSYHVAEQAGRIVGVVGMRDNSHLYHLFVSEEMHRQGLGRALWRAARQACRAAGNPGDFTVYSSHYAVGFYEALGFRREGENVREGVVAIAMSLREDVK